MGTEPGEEGSGRNAQATGPGEAHAEPEVHRNVARALAAGGTPVAGYSVRAEIQARSQRRIRIWVGCVVVLAVALIGAGAAYWNARPGPLATAYEKCGYEDELGVRLADGGATLLLQTVGEENSIGIDYVGLLCVYGALDMPARITTQIGSTRALDGRVSDSWDRFAATWSYHPNSGLDLMITTE
ncbi:hypothetical protein [Pseudactinotalea sp. Z1748]|uniref:hypothetical protein n=1 Tax=Pseudactinotalea sp. Z1748 TaxID=3413027 RepID=UPI003C7E39EE